MSVGAERGGVVSRVLTDRRYRSGVTLRISLAASAALLLYQGYVAVSRQSAWSAALMLEHVVLVAMRAGLLVRMVRPGSGRDEWRAYRLCSRLILALALVLAVIATLSTVAGMHKDLGVIACIAYAAWCFYLVGVAAADVVRYRALKSPVISATKATSLAGALISLYSMQGALIARFAEDAPDFATRMNATTGGLVFIALVVMAVYMSRRARAALSGDESEA